MIKGGGGLKELEKRLRDEPDNIGLRVTVAGGMREAGRLAEAVELYRSVAIAYRDQGRTMQAIAVCRSILEIAPNDIRCKELLVVLETPAPTPLPAIPVATPKPPLSKRDPLDDAPRRPAVVIEAVPQRISSSGRLDETPLPRPMPYHVADPTQSIPKLSISDLPTRASSEVSELDTDPKTMAIPARGSQQDVGHASSLDLDLSAELETRQRRRITTGELDRLVGTEPVARIDETADDAPFMSPATTPVPRFDLDDEAPPLPPVRATSPVAVVDGVPTDTEEELTLPRDMRFEPREPPARRTIDPLSTRFFAPMPVDRRASALSRFHRRAPKAGDVVIKKGETNHPFVIVLKGELEVRTDRGAPYAVGVGEHVGEASLLARGASAITVVAPTGDCQLLLLLPADFYEIVGRFPALWAELKASADRR